MLLAEKLRKEKAQGIIGNDCLSRLFSSLFIFLRGFTLSY
uniref:Uncharacterized protein n=1 Tax=Manihot esculenta TaxID=3983 RepID=A0A2C9UR77_MANES